MQRKRSSRWCNIDDGCGPPCAREVFDSKEDAESHLIRVNHHRNTRRLRKRFEDEKYYCVEVCNDCKKFIIDRRQFRVTTKIAHAL